MKVLDKAGEGRERGAEERVAIRANIGRRRRKRKGRSGSGGGGGLEVLFLKGTVFERGSGLAPGEKLGERIGVCSSSRGSDLSGKALLLLLLVVLRRRGLKDIKTMRKRLAGSKRRSRSMGLMVNCTVKEVGGRKGSFGMSTARNLMRRRLSDLL